MRESNPSEQTGSLVFILPKSYCWKKKCLPLGWALSLVSGEKWVFPERASAHHYGRLTSNQGIYAMGQSFPLLTTERVEGISIMGELEPNEMNPTQNDNSREIGRSPNIF